jgi:signal peptidase I
MNEQNEVIEDSEEIVEMLIDQENDFTIETLSIRKSLRFRMPIILFEILLFYILLYFDSNIDFNPVNSSVFIGITGGILLLIVIIYYVNYHARNKEYFHKSYYYGYKALNETFDFLSVIPHLILLITIFNMSIISFSPISGSSMEPNYHDDEAVVFSHTKDTYERFDVIIIYEDSLSDPYLIKRVIGLPGETVVIDDNEIYINGDLITQDFIDQTQVHTYCVNGGNTNYCSFTVPNNSYFVLGDNRDGQAQDDTISGYSIDSRTFGSVNVENIYGKVIWKFKDFNFLN